jgi:hypothetical protein
MSSMLGLLDLLKAVRGSAAMRLRRTHRMTGPALFVLLWVLALGSFFWLAGRDHSGSDDESPGVAEAAGSTSATTPPAGSRAQVDSDADAGEAVPPGLSPTTTTAPTGGDPAVGADPGSRIGDVAAATPTTVAATPNRPSWTTSTSVPATTATTAPRSPATTTTTAAPADNGGILGDLLDALGLG